MEEEYAQNNKNHEEEVQLRLKFEGKLNNLLRDKRLVETTLGRSEQLNKEYKQKLDGLEKQSAILRTQNKDLKTEMVSQNSRMTANLEKINSLYS